MGLMFFVCVIACVLLSNPCTYGRVTFQVPSLTPDEWKSIDHELKAATGVLHHDLASDRTSPNIAGSQFTRILTDILINRPDSEFVNEVKNTEYKKSTPKTLLEAARIKNGLRKKAFGKHSTEEDRKAFRQAVKAHNQLKRIQRKKNEKSATKKQETMYKKNFWQFAKRCSNGTLDKTPLKPTFSVETANAFYQGTYAVCNPVIVPNLHWFPHLPVDEATFNLDPVRPKHIRSILQHKKPTSAPGEDGIMYGILRKLPSSHLFLATMFTKLLATADPPDEWSDSMVTLIHKDGATDDPKCFRMIALTSCIGKLFHQILADRVERFATDNKILDPATQKAFLKGINGCVENNQVVHELLLDAKKRNKTIHITFFDLQDAFGSVEHNLLYHVLDVYRFPVQIQRYVRNLYSRLNGRVRGDKWVSAKFPFRRGVFQGDPLFPHDVPSGLQPPHQPSKITRKPLWLQSERNSLYHRPLC